MLFFAVFGLLCVHQIVAESTCQTLERADDSTETYQTICVDATGCKWDPSKYCHLGPNEASCCLSAEPLDKAEDVEATTCQTLDNADKSYQAKCGLTYGCRWDTDQATCAIEINQVSCCLEDFGDEEEEEDAAMTEEEDVGIPEDDEDTAMNEEEDTAMAEGDEDTAISEAEEEEDTAVIDGDDDTAMDEEAEDVTISEGDEEEDAAITDGDEDAAISEGEEDTEGVEDVTISEGDEDAAKTEGEEDVTTGQEEEDTAVIGGDVYRTKRCQSLDRAEKTYKEICGATFGCQWNTFSACYLASNQATCCLAVDEGEEDTTINEGDEDATNTEEDEDVADTEGDEDTAISEGDEDTDPATAVTPAPTTPAPTAPVTPAPITPVTPAGGEEDTAISEGDEDATISEGEEDAAMSEGDEDTTINEGDEDMVIKGWMRKRGDEGDEDNALSEGDKDGIISAMTEGDVYRTKRCQSLDRAEKTYKEICGATFGCQWNTFSACYLGLNQATCCLAVNEAEEDATINEGDDDTTITEGDEDTANTEEDEDVAMTEDDEDTVTEGDEDEAMTEEDEDGTISEGEEDTANTEEDEDTTITEGDEDTAMSEGDEDMVIKGWMRKRGDDDAISEGDEYTANAAIKRPTMHSAEKWEMIHPAYKGGDGELLWHIYYGDFSNDQRFDEFRSKEMWDARMIRPIINENVEFKRFAVESGKFEEEKSNTVSESKSSYGSWLIILSIIMIGIFAIWYRYKLPSNKINEEYKGENKPLLKEEKIQYA